MVRRTLFARVSGTPARSTLSACRAFMRASVQARRVVPCIVAMLPILAPSAPLAQIISPDVRVSTYLRWQSEPSIAALGDRAVAAWNNRLFVGGGVGWGYSTDGGQTWIDGHQLPSFQGNVLGGQATVCADNAGSFYLVGLGGDRCWWSMGFYRGSFQGATFGGQ